jgi:biopolymer transport protein ExbB/TolQ
MPTPAKTAAAIALGGTLVGVVGTLVGVLKAFIATGARGEGPAAQARMLAEGISLAMNSTAFGVAVSTPAIVAALVLVRRSSQRSGHRNPRP